MNIDQLHEQIFSTLQDKGISDGKIDYILQKDFLVSLQQSAIHLFHCLSNRIYLQSVEYIDILLPSILF